MIGSDQDGAAPRPATAFRSSLWFGSLVGLATALVIVFFVEGLQLNLSPLPASLDRSDPAQFATIPLTDLLLQLASWFAGAFVGSLTAQRLTERAASGWAPTLVIIAICLLNRIALAMPGWMVVAGVALPVVAHWLATRTAARWAQGRR